MKLQLLIEDEMKALKLDPKNKDDVKKFWDIKGLGNEVNEDRDTDSPYRLEGAIVGEADSAN